METAPAVGARPVFWEQEGKRAARLGDWKLVSSHPERARDLIAQWEAWAARVGVLPRPVAKGKTDKSGSKR